MLTRLNTYSRFLGLGLVVCFANCGFGHAGIGTFDSPQKDENQWGLALALAAPGNSNSNRVLGNFVPATAAAVQQWGAVTYGSGQFVAVHADGNAIAMASPDGATWTTRNTPTAAWREVIYSGGRFVAIGSSGTTSQMSSQDGNTWTGSAPTSGLTPNPNTVAYGNGLYVSLISQPSNSRFITSPDGNAWTERTGQGGWWDAMTYAAGQFVAVGMNCAMTSPDGLNWTVRTPAAAQSWSSIAYGNGLFVAVARNFGQAMTSPDGINWTLRPVVAASNWGGIVYAEGLFMAVAASGTERIMTSPDGLTWTAHTPPVTSNWQGVTYGNGRFVIVGSSGTNRVLWATW